MWRRLAATLADLAILAAILGALHFLFGAEIYQGTFTQGADPGDWRYSLTASTVTNVVLVVYFLVLSTVLRRTPGKWALGLRVVSAETGERVGVGQHLGRTFASLISLLTFLIGYFWLVVSRKRQTFHDKLASTLVVRARPDAEPPAV